MLALKISSWMLPNVQRAKVESKSQPELGCIFPYLRCYQMYKELKLKANHNEGPGIAKKRNDVTKCTKS